jgi:hypothetical protein
VEAGVVLAAVEVGAEAVAASGDLAAVVAEAAVRAVAGSFGLLGR